MKVAKKKSDLMNSIQASTPVVWLQTKEDNRIVKSEIYELLRKGVSKQAYIYNALDQLSESVIFKKGSSMGNSGGRKETMEHYSQAIRWFVKWNPEAEKEAEKSVSLDADQASPSAPETASTYDSITSNPQFRGNSSVTSASNINLPALGSAKSYAPSRSVLFLLDVASTTEHKNGSKWSNGLLNRLIKDSLEDLIGQEKTIVFVSHSFDIPLELQGIAELIESLPLSHTEMKSIVSSMWMLLFSTKEKRVDISEKMEALAIDLIKGMTEVEASNLLALSVVVNKNKRSINAEHPLEFDIETIRTGKSRSIKNNSSLEIIKPPGSLDQVGGLLEIKDWAHSIKNLYSEEAASEGIEPPKGIVLFGPGGVGKTHVISCLGMFLERTVLRWDVGASKNKYVGETESQTRKVFKDAKAQSPCILFIDEAGKLFSSAKGGGSDLDSGVSQGMYAALLTFMQENDGGVIIAMACNEDIVNFPAPALRSGRIDRVFFVDIPDRQSIKEVLNIHLNKTGWQKNEVDIDYVTGRLVGYTPAEIKDIVNQALVIKYKKDGPRPAMLKTEHLEEAIKDKVPMTKTNEKEVTDIRNWAIERGYLKTNVSSGVEARSTGRRLGASFASTCDEEEED